MSERKEALMRILIGIVCGIILGVWNVVTEVVVVIHFIYAIFTNKRHKEMAEFTNKWITYAYSFVRYITFATNKRPFPFNDFGEDIEKVDMKK